MARIAMAGFSYTESFTMRIVQQISTLLIVYACICTGYAQTDNDCGLERFRCRNGECIAGELLCNGRADCKDSSDETETECKKIPCPDYSFRCNYGGCINKDYVCNGNQDCVDNSDETQPQCRTTTGRKNQTKRSIQCEAGSTCNNEIRCKALSTPSVEARCSTYDDEWMLCESPVPPGTKAELACRNSYRRETSLLSSRRDNVICNANGQWEPEPIRCVPVCGTLPSQQTPLKFGRQPNITEFPWHASMYRDTSRESKKYFCGASIILEKLLITAAHCVYDEKTQRVIDANKIYIVTGNIYRNYDSPLHDPRLVKKNQVKNIYMECNYLGHSGNYLSDIAILELVEPFVLSSWLVPVCIDIFSDRNTLEPGTYGKVAGFGRTAVSDSSAVLQALTVPYIPFSQCKSASKNASSSICDGDGGSGLVFKTNDLWYLQGIASVSLSTILDGGTARCGHNSYGLYTKISSHVIWIQDIIARVEQNRTHSLC